MKKLAFLCLLAAIALAGMSPVKAQEIMGQYGGFATPMGASTIPSITTPEQVMLLHHVLANRRPDFKALARLSDEYKAANDFDKDRVMQGKITALRNNFEMTSAEDKLVVRMPVTVSSFSVRNKGFVINELNDNMNFKYTYSGKNYAFIPIGMSEHQWIDASDDATALTIDKARGPGNAYTLFITFAPNYADPPDRMTVLDDEKEYTIMTGPTSNIALYDVTGKEKLWTNARKAVVDPINDNLLKLKQ